MLLLTMSKTAKILVSNIGLPSYKIGSWTTRMSMLIKNNLDLFDYILSPANQIENSILCKKRSFLTWKKPLRKIQILNWVALDYLSNIKKLSKKYDKLIVVVMDDPHLIEAIGLIKNKLRCEVELIFSYHGFNLSIDTAVLQSINSILFLSKRGYEISKGNNKNFPKGVVVGNAVNSQVFYPLDPEEYKKQRQIFGYSETDEVLIWMANDRLKKGFHIFKDVVKELFKNNEDLKVLILGTNQTINSPNVKSIGRIPNNEVAKYLQLGNHYMFTTLYDEGFGLSMIEAYKCGNAIIASNKGAIREVLEGLNNTHLIENPNDLDSWVSNYNKARLDKKKLNKEQTNVVWNYPDWEEKFINAIQ